MSPRVLHCPSCRAPLAPPGRFAREVTCTYCAARVMLDETGVEAAGYRAARAEWNDPSRLGITDWCTVDGEHWTLGARVGTGRISDVHLARRARWPSGFGVVHLLRDPRDLADLERGWRALVRLRTSRARGAAILVNRLPLPLSRGTVARGWAEGRPAMVLGWVPGFRHSLIDVRAAHPGGIDPRASVWLWRRLLESLDFIHREGMVHGAVLPQHVLIEDGEHGARLVGFGSADVVAAERRAEVEPKSREFLPPDAGPGARLRPSMDLVMAARTVIFALGGDPARQTVPSRVPAPLAALLEACASAERNVEREDALALHARIGDVSRAVFGAPSFNPLVMPR